MLNHSCILAIDEGNRHERNGKGRNSGKGLDTGAGLRKAGAGITDYCQLMNWKVVKVFANKVSGSTRNADREEISGLVDYARSIA